MIQDNMDEKNKTIFLNKIEEKLEKISGQDIKDIENL